MSVMSAATWRTPGSFPSSGRPGNSLTARAAIRGAPGSGRGTSRLVRLIPYLEDAPEAVRRGVVSFERGEPAALDGLLAAARPQDGLTLWHLLTRVPASDRGAVFDRFRDLVHLPASVSRDAVLRRAARAIDQCWNALDLENTGWWRGWERRWP